MANALGVPFDVFLVGKLGVPGHIDETTALEPLERWAQDEVDVPETHPTGL